MKIRAVFLRVHKFHKPTAVAVVVWRLFFQVAGARTWPNAFLDLDSI